MWFWGGGGAANCSLKCKKVPKARWETAQRWSLSLRKNSVNLEQTHRLQSWLQASQQERHSFCWIGKIKQPKCLSWEVLAPWLVTGVFGASLVPWEGCHWAPRWSLGVVGMGGAEASPPSDGVKALKVSEVEGEWMDYALLGKKGHINTLQGVGVTPVKVKSTHWVKAEQISVLLCVSPSWLELPWLLWWQFWMWPSEAHSSPHLTGTWVGCWVQTTADSVDTSSARELTEILWWC